MSARSILQRIGSFVADLADDVVQFASADVREAVLADLGGAPGTSRPIDVPEATLANVRAFTKAVDPDAQAEAEAIGNIAILLGTIIDQIEAWDAGWAARGDAFMHLLLDLVASNYVRRKWPTLFLFLQAFVNAVELTDTHGPSRTQNTPFRFGSAIATIFSFVWNPGRTLDDLDDTREGAKGSTLETAGDVTLLVLDGLVRGAIATIAVIDQIKLGKEHRDNFLDDFIVGWDAKGLDVDSEDRPSAADILSSRMISASFRRAGAVDEEVLKATWLYIPKRTGVPARPHQLFLSLGGRLAIDVPIRSVVRLDETLDPAPVFDEPEIRFRTSIAADAATSLLLSSDGNHKASAAAGTLEFGLGWTIKPDEAGITYVLHSWPKSLGVRVELGSLGAHISVSGDSARAIFRADQAALVIDGASRDSFMRKLLGGRPIRYPFSAAIGLDSELGFIHQIHTASNTPAAGAEPPFDSSGPAGPADLSMTLPLGGGGLLGVNIHEIVVRLAYQGESEDRPGWAVAAGVLISFSTTIGPVYLRVDRLGLGATADTTPREERNLRVVEAGFEASAPLGVAIQIDTKLVTGGGTIQHNPATGDYVGALVLRLGKKVALTCIGLAATKDAAGNPESSLILIGTVEHLDLQAGFVTFDGFGLIYLGDRRIDETAIRAALPTGQLRNILFPADPVKHLPELTSTLRTFFPVQRGVHAFGLLVKLYFGAGRPLIRADLALLLERDSVADKSRLVVLGRVSSVLPQDKDAIVRLNLDAIGVFDLDTGEIAIDAVLYESKLFGRFVLTGAAAFRRRSGEGFALAIGGFNPRFQPPSNFPVLPRIRIALTAGDNPKLIIEAYIAVTSNTVQFGASASLYASAYGFSIEGYIGFDVLIQLWPPHFLAEFRAGIQLKRGSRNLFKVDVRGALEGPIPLRLAGRATFGILWWDYTIGFDRTLIGGSQPVVTETLDVLAELVARLSSPTSWRAEPLPVAASIASMRKTPASAAPDQPLLLHPLGRLEVRQGVVPFNLDRDIDRVGAFVPAGSTRRFAITEAAIGPAHAEAQPVFDDFPDGQFFDLSDDERLAAPSFVRREAGVAFGIDAYRTDAAAAANSPVGYTDITIGLDGVPVTAPAPQPPPRRIFETGFRIGAAARALSRTGRSERYAEPVLAAAPRIDLQRRRA